MKIKTGFIGLFLVFSLNIATEVPRPTRGQSGSVQVFLPVTYSHFDSGPGVVKGVVIDATNGSAIQVATICYEKNCVHTDQAGRYQFVDISAGAQYFHATATDHYPVGRWTNVKPYQENQLNIAMSPKFSISKVAMRIVTTWSANPCWPVDSNPPCLSPAYENDLDAFLWVTTAGIKPTLVWNSDPNVSITQCTSYPNACKENDAREGTGPETIAIQAFTAGSSYYFGVLNYNQYQPPVPPMSGTQASVSVYNVYNDQGLIDTFDVPNIGTGNFWYVFSLDAAGNIHPQNCIIELSPFDGTLPDCSLKPTGRAPRMPEKP
jgi:hypothetical protein